MTLIDCLNIEFVHVTDEGFESAMTLSEFHAQPMGYLNGGATLAYAEVAAGMASMKMGAGAYVAVGQSVTAQHIRPMKAEGRLLAFGELLHAGKRNHVWSIRMKNEAGQLISQVTVVNAQLHEK